MFQVRFHGRGGQDVVTAAEPVAEAAFREGWHAQAFPGLGSERMGAPVMSFCRVDDKTIRTHEPVTEPDALQRDRGRAGIFWSRAVLHGQLEPGLLRRLRPATRSPHTAPATARPTGIFPVQFSLAGCVDR